MCGRYVIGSNDGELATEFDVESALPDWIADHRPPRYNIAPTDPVPAIVVAQRGDLSGQRTMTALRWGLVPSWAKDPTIGSRMINARSETVAEKPSFRKAFRTRRCLLPASGYYEWYRQTDEQGKVRKRPHFIHRDDGRLLAMAGLYEWWHDDAGIATPDGEPGWLGSCTIITTAAADSVGHLHDRMPMVIEADGWQDWLSPDLTEPEDIWPLLAVTQAERLQAYEVGTAVGNVAAQGPDLIEPLAD
ncbi:SOS response-associated peptidase [Parenemella sanctibonifatiensis]|uniref:Abasic site processing protein n=1 Tax=Parenemella sanctibonifatiensis TaxID=2016505 RepID=A0A255E504_9ACTN|nr:SOS response-associated peptidase [Parenemella sanctibonifatiensis]OYN86624.1 DUF159 family protein [Parenemella sanctibonifatiensis]